MVLLIFAGCMERQQYPQSLLTADSLANTNPDSAVSYLRGLEPTMANAPKADRMLYELLCIKALDKAYKLTVSVDSILKIVHFYESDGDKSLLPTAYYYAGRIYSDAHDAPTALNYFQKSLDAMEGDEYQELKPLVYSKMGYLFLFQYLYEEAEECFQQSYAYAKSKNDTLNMLYGLRDIAITLQWQNRYSECLRYLRQAEEMVSLTSCTKMKVQITQDAASIATDLKNYSLAKLFMQIPMWHIELTDSSSTYYNMMRIFYGIGKLDSCMFFANKIERTGSVYAKHKAYQFLTEINLGQHKVKESAHTFQQYLTYSDSISRITKTADLQRALSNYNYQKKEKEYQELETANAIKIWSLCCVLTIAASGILVLYMLYHNYRIKTKDKIARITKLQQERYQRSEDFVKKNVEQIANLEFKIDLLKKENLTLIENIEAQKKELENHKEQLTLQNVIAKAELDEHKRAQKAVVNSKIREEVIKKADADCILNNNEWEKVEEIILNNYPDFKEQLFDLHNFSRQEYHVTLLIKMQIDPFLIARLTAHTKASISLTRSRLYKKCFGEKGAPEQWDEFVNSL